MSTHKTLEHISIVVFIAAVAWLYYTRPSKGSIAPQSATIIQQSAPWFLLYNYPVGFTGNSTPPLPGRSLGQQFATTEPECATCSLFPVTNTAQY